MFKYCEVINSLHQRNLVKEILFLFILLTKRVILNKVKIKSIFQLQQ